MYRAAAVLVLLAALVPAPLRSQTGESRDLRLARLRARFAELQARAERQDSLAALQLMVRLDTLRAAGLVVLTDSAQAPALRSALPILEEQVRARLGTVPLELLRDARVLVRFGNAGPGWTRLITGDAQFLHIRDARASADLARDLRHSLAVVLAARGGSGLQQWAGADLRIFEDQRVLREAAFIELTTSAARPARACLRGDVPACAVAVGLAPLTDPGGWYEPGSARAVVQRRLRPRATDPAVAPRYRACVDDGDDPACLSLVDQFPAPYLSTRAAVTLLQTAATMGGSEAYARFFADSTPPIRERVERAAGVPLDSVVAEWRSAVLAARPAPTRVPRRSQWTAVLWAAVFAVAAAGSTRWR